MKILVLGDIHGKTHWKNVIEKEQPDLTIFLGDYVSSHEYIDAATQITNLEAIMQYKEENKDSVILLRGNHDMQHCGYYWAKCSGLYPPVAQYLSKHRDRFLSLTQWIYIKDNIIFSHAGISTEWMKWYDIKSVNEINALEPSEIFGFTPCKLSDYNGISATQPCTWIRPQTLMECALEDYIHVVGHSTVEKIVEVSNLIKEKYPEYKCKAPIWLCDNFPSQYLVINDNEFIVMDYDEAI